MIYEYITVRYTTENGIEHTEEFRQLYQETFGEPIGLEKWFEDYQRWIKLEEFIIDVDRKEFMDTFENIYRKI